MMLSLAFADASHSSHFWKPFRGIKLLQEGELLCARNGVMTAEVL
jgi:hypothetical protein